MWPAKLTRGSRRILAVGHHAGACARCGNLAASSVAAFRCAAGRPTRPASLCLVVETDGRWALCAACARHVQRMFLSRKARGVSRSGLCLFNALATLLLPSSQRLDRRIFQCVRDWLELVHFLKPEIQNSVASSKCCNGMLATRNMDMVSYYHVTWPRQPMLRLRPSCWAS